MRQLARRIVNFVRPAPRYIPLSVRDILSAQSSADIVDRFNDLYYASGVSGTLFWRGIPVLKNPCDLWVVVELIQTLRPTAIVETGTHVGGSATFYADMGRLAEAPCTVVTVDINPKWDYDPATRGIVSLKGASTDARVHRQVVDEVAGARQRRDGHVMVFLDSDHGASNVLDELELYAPLVTRGSYIVVEDTNVNGHPSFPSHGPGPWEAVDQFLAANTEFVVDEACQRHLLTYNPRGWLKRI